MANDIDELQIQIQASAKGANSSVTALTKRLEKLSSVINGIDAKKVNNLGIGLNNVGRGGNTASAGLNKTSASAKKAATSFNGLASAFGKFYATYFLFIRGAKSVWKGIESSMDYVETSNYFSVALGEIGRQFESAGYESAELYTEALSSELNKLNEKLTGYSVGSKGEALFSGSVGLGMDIEQMMNFQAKTLAVTNSVGLMGEASLETAKAVSMLAGDISSLTNTDLETVMTNLSSGLIGQSRSLYKYGYDITQNTLQQYALAEGIDKAVSEMTQSEKMQLRLIAILDQANVAEADLSRTINSVANQYRIFGQQIDNTGRTLGNLFLPIVKNVLPWVNGLIIAINNLLTSLGFQIYGDTWLEDLQDGISGGVQEDFEDFEGSVDDATDSVEKFKKSVRGFDELNVLTGGTSVGSGVLGELEGQIDLTDRIADAVADYESAWDEAFANAENKANTFAETLTKMFEETGAVENFVEIVDSIKEFNKAISPFAEGFGEGFLGFFGTLAETSLTVFNTSLDLLSDIIGEIEPATLEEFGKAFGVLVGSVTALTALGAISSKFKALSDGFSLLGTTLKAHPILSTFVLASGILELADLFNNSGDAEDVAESYGTIEDNIEGISGKVETLNGNLDTFKTRMSEINSGGKLGKVFLEWQKLNSKVGELTDDEKGKLAQYGTFLEKKFPELIPYIEDNGAAYGDAALKVEEVINNAIKLYQVEATRELYIEAFKTQVEAEKALLEAQENNNNYLEQLRTTFSKLSDEELQQAIETYNKIGQFSINGKSAMKIQLERSGYTGNLLEALFTDKELNWDIFLTGGSLSAKDAESIAGLGADAQKTLENAEKAYQDAADAVDYISDSYQRLTGETETLKTETEGLAETFKEGELIKNGAEQLDYLDSLFDTRPKEMGENVSKGVEEGVKKGTGGAIGAMNALGGSMLSRFAEVCMIHSPSKVMEEYGGYLIDGLVDGIENNMQKVLDSISVMGNKIQKKMYEYDLSYPNFTVPKYSDYATGIVGNRQQTYSEYSFVNSNSATQRTSSSEKITVDVTLDLDGETIYRKMLERETQRAETGRNSFKTVALTK